MASASLSRNLGWPKLENAIVYALPLPCFDILVAPYMGRASSLTGMAAILNEYVTGSAQFLFGAT